MTTTAAERVVLDTNVLLAATDEGRPEHAHALATLNDWPAAGTALYITGQILREYLTVATRPVADNGLGLAQPDAMTNARAMRERVRLLPESVRVTDQLLSLLDELDVIGKQIHDTNIVATMLTHGIDTLVTSNLADFNRYEGHIRVVAP